MAATGLHPTRRRRIRLSAPDRTFYAITYLVLILLLLIILLPLINVASQSLSSPSAVLGQKVFLLPVEFSGEAYRIIAGSPMILAGFFNTVFYTVAGTALNVILTMMCAYPLSRKGLPGHNAFTFYFSFTMLFGGGMIPNYLLIRSLHMLDTRWVMIIPGAMSVWNMVIARTYLQNTIPETLYEAAEIDGANDLQVLGIVIPLSKPILAVLCLFYAVGHWNSYFNAMMYLSSQELFNLQLVLRNVLSNIETLYQSNDTVSMVQADRMAAMGEVLKYAIIVFASIPIMCVYPFVQKHFVKGIMVGSLKG